MAVSVRVDARSSAYDSTFGIVDRRGVWTKVVVDGVPRDEWGLTWLKVPPGTHVVSFSDAPTLGTPALMTVEVQAGAVVTGVVGVFRAYGGLKIETSPPVPSTIYVNGEPANDWGMWQSMEPGTYRVSFGPVAGYIAPDPQTAVLVAGELTSVVGTYLLAVHSQSQARLRTSWELHREP